MEDERAVWLVVLQQQTMTISEFTLSFRAKKALLMHARQGWISIVGNQSSSPVQTLLISWYFGGIFLYMVSVSFILLVIFNLVNKVRRFVWHVGARHWFCRSWTEIVWLKNNSYTEIHFITKVFGKLSVEEGTPSLLSVRTENKVCSPTL